MLYNPEKHRRRTIRLQDYDYSQAGAYFITVCTKNRECLFGEISDGKIVLNEFGQIVESVWLDLPKHYPNIELDAFVIMPNHIHGIVFIVGAGLKPAPTKPANTIAPTKVMKNYPLSEIVRGFKTFSSRKINEMRFKSGMSLWQRNYHEHIIRKEESLNCIREYIMINPLGRDLDEENPHQKGDDEFYKWFKRQFIKGETNS